jgi:anaerobic magnesium-protoporphyrin IX monomethyl ester cyclase
MYLTSMLTRAGVDVSLVDNTFEPDLSTIENAIRKENPDLVGISAVEITRKTALQICSIAKKHGCLVIVGGPDPVNYRTEYFKSGADWICAGEGENTLLELAEKLRANQIGEIYKIPGLYVMKNGEEYFTGNRELIPNLDLLPFPSWNLIPAEKYLDAWSKAHGETSLAVVSSRGCPRGCKWCSRSVFGRTLRRRSPENFLDETNQILSAYNPGYVWIADDSFTSSIDWLLQFKSRIDETNVHFKYECLGRVDEITEDIAKILKSTGCGFIWFGAESGSQRVLDSMGKGFKVGEIERARNIMRDYKIPVGFFIMMAYPPEDVDDFRATVSMIKKLKPDKVGVSVAYPIAGTEFYKDVIDDVIGNQSATGWISSGENRPIFKTKYSPSFYRFARRLLLKEAQLAGNPISMMDKAKIAFYETGVRFLSLTGNPR